MVTAVGIRVKLSQAMSSVEKKSTERGLVWFRWIHFSSHEKASPLKHQLNILLFLKI
jgi:hypothetical protein